MMPGSFWIQGRTVMQQAAGVTAHQHSFQTNCAACALAGVCLPIAVSGDELDVLEDIIERRGTQPRGHYVYRAGDPFTSLYVVRSGAVKSLRVTPAGEEQIVGFHLPGEIFGLDGIGGQLHESAAVALESCAVCAIPFARLTEQRPVLHTMNAHLLQLLSREIVTDQHLLILLGKRTAEERIAAMLVSLSSRFRRRRLSPTRFRLPMSRADLGSYLGLVIETVSRVLTRLQRQGLVRINQREIEILDLPRLHDVAGIAPPLNDA